MTRRLRLSAFFGLLGLVSCPAFALDLELPLGAEQTAERRSVFDTFQAPIGVFDGATVPKVEIEGAINRRTWRISARDLTPLQLMAPLREQLVAAGFATVFECASTDCGGFDFRFDIEVLPGPNMFVDISQYRYLTAVRGDRNRPEDAVGVLASVTAGAAYLQIIEARTQDPASLPVVAVTPANRSETSIEETGALDAAPEEENDLGEKLLASGRVVLYELDFPPGSSVIEKGPHASLEALAQFLENRPDQRIALVGHTDTFGALEANIALSRARAVSVRVLLIEEHGIDPARIDAEGMGYLAPIASNLTQEGRDQNRRVEAILLTE